MTIYRVLGAIGAGLAALAAFLLALPADANIPDLLVIIVSGSSAFINAVLIFLASPLQLARVVLNKHSYELKVAELEKRKADND